MKIDVRLYASLARYLPGQPAGNACMMDLPEGTTVSDVLNRLDVPIKTVKLIFINSVHAQKETVLKDGDRLGLFPPVAGG